jgi:hypothetical protein
MRHIKKYIVLWLGECRSGESDFKSIDEFGFVEPEQHLLTKKQVQSFVPYMFIDEDVVIVPQEQPFQHSSVELVFTLEAGVVGSTAKQLNEVEPCF